jgi:hypothetical protein
MLFARGAGAEKSLVSMERRQPVIIAMRGEETSATYITHLSTGTMLPA